MSATAGSGENEPDEPTRRAILAPYTAKHPVPTVQGYQQVQEQRRQQERLNDGEDEQEPGLRERAKEKLGLASPSSEKEHPYESFNRNEHVPQSSKNDQQDSTTNTDDERDGVHSNETQSDEVDPQNNTSQSPRDTTESHVVAGDARTKRKAMKKRGPKGTRIVTDPVTHLQMAIHDLTRKELRGVEENLAPPGGSHETDTSETKSTQDIDKEQEEVFEGDLGVRRVFPPPSFDLVRQSLVKYATRALWIWFGAVSSTAILLLSCFWTAYPGSDKKSDGRFATSLKFLLPVVACVTFLAFSGLTLHTWLSNQIRRSWDDQIWEAARREERKQAESPAPESTQWLNRLLASIWPLVNPDLFVAMADTIEDVMQASLPRFVRMVAVEDFGQGSESIRILGVRWLPTGAAAKSVNVDGDYKADSDKKNDRAVSGEGKVQNDDSKPDESQQQEQSDQAIAEGLEKEEGEFINIEIALAYRARENDKRLSKKTKNAHLLIKFYLPGSLPIPIWVSLQGFVAVVRMRLQLTPDPPFIALATITLVGQPNAEMQAIPLAKHFLNVMDLPFISGFVQSSIDAALAEYVAPRSLTLNIKEMLMGDDFKKDTIARGVIIIHIKSAYGFKEADISIPGIKHGSADPYITVGWAKFGKPMWSSRVILKSMNPVWDEVAFLLVTPEELNAGERLRIQLWDSDRTTADDDVGRIEVDLKEIMDGKSRGRMVEREDGFIAMDADKEMPGHLKWSAGYFPKVRLSNRQLQQQKLLPEIKTREELKEAANAEAEKKTREASVRDMSDEIEQNKEASFVEKEISLTAAAPPPHGYPSGIFSIQLHNITGLNLQVLQKNRDQYHNEGTEGSEVSDELPSAYATVIINGQKVYKTRVKPKNTKPFFNASTERFIRDWRHTEVMVGVRDARVHEDDALIGMIYLNLGEVFAKRAQIDGTYPLVGGIGFGRFRISMVFRACNLQLPAQFLGWEYGTVEIAQARSSDLPEDLQQMRLKVKGPLGKGKLHPAGDANAEWKRRKGGNLKIGVAHRYSSCLTFEFRKISGPDKTAAFGVFWLSNIPDGIGQTIQVDIWRGGRGKQFDRARTHCIEDCSEDKIGELYVDMKFWPGLSEYQRGLAKKNINLRNVMEVLDTARDNNLVTTSLYEKKSKSQAETAAHQNAHENDVDEHSKRSSDSESSDDEKDEEDIAMHNGHEYYDDNEDSDNSLDEAKEPESLKNSKHPQSDFSPSEDSRQDDDGSRGLLQQIQDYRDHSKTLNRQERGAMQWKIPRTVKWLRHKAESGKNKVVSAVGHHDREPDVETEV